MALAITISTAGGGAIAATTYRLQADTLRYGIERSPLQAPLSGRYPFIIDLGQYKPRIIIDGILGTTAGSDGGVIIPSFFNLVAATLLWWDTSITLSFTGYSELCKFQSLQGTLTAAKEEFWVYSLTFVEGKIE